MLENNMVLEGGAIEQNGQGTIMTTEQCLLNSGRNSNLTKEQIENNIKNFLGAKKIIWLPRGLANDHTDGHIDDIARFVSPNKILCAYENDRKNQNYKILDDNYKIFQNSTDVNGKKFEIVKLPMPHMRYDKNKPFEAGSLAPASYTNFYIGNTVVLVPIYNDINDAEALKTIQSCFPNRKVKGVDSRDLIYGGGSIHCMTREQPAL